MTPAGVRSHDGSQESLDLYLAGEGRGIRALDELFALARRYRTGAAYRQLLEFTTRFRRYAPFNAMLVHIQLPGAVYVASPARWWREFGHRVKPEARPLVILQPRGPVMFVFDVSDTEPGPDAVPLPPEVLEPFAVTGCTVGAALERTIENAKRDGVEVRMGQAGSQGAGAIGRAEAGRSLVWERGEGAQPRRVRLPVRYHLLLNTDHAREVRYATLTHELAHLYCGHLGTPNERWWPDRRGVPHVVREFEAESVSYLVCRRRGIESPSSTYLAQVMEQDAEVPPISLDRVMAVAGSLEQMGRERLPARPRERT